MIDHQRWAKAKIVDWATFKLRVNYLHLVSGPNPQLWNVACCYGEMAGQPVRVDLPFNQLPKGAVERAIVQYAKTDRVYAHGLGILKNITTEEK